MADVAQPSGSPSTPSNSPTRVPTSNSPGAFQIASLKSQEKQRYLKFLVYGGPGIGKSTLAGSATNHEGMRDVLLITAEGGDIVFEDNDNVHMPDNIDILKIDRIEQLQKAFEFLQHHVRARDANDEKALKGYQDMVFGGLPQVEPNRLRKYRTVILDSLTDIEAANMNAVLGQQDKGFEVGSDFEAAGFAQFRKNNNTIQAIVRSFRNLEVNIIIICGQKYSQDELKRYHYTPWLTGQLATQVQSFVDLVGYLVVSTADPSQPDLRRLYTQPQSGVRFDAKCRRASIKRACYDNPSMPDIMKDFGFIR